MVNSKNGIKGKILSFNLRVFAFKLEEAEYVTQRLFNAQAIMFLCYFSKNKAR